jgi:copper(I)-binding protein
MYNPIYEISERRKQHLKKSLYYCFILVFTTVFVFSCRDGGTPDIRVKGPKMVGTGDIAIFLLLVNDGNGSDSLVGCSLKEYPHVRGEMHDIIGGQMREVKEIAVPAGELVDLKRGSLHLMFFGLPEELPEKMTLKLKFKKSGDMEVEVPTRKS